MKMAQLLTLVVLVALASPALKAVEPTVSLPPYSCTPFGDCGYSIGFSFKSADPSETAYWYHPWRGRVSNKMPLATTWTVYSYDRIANLEMMGFTAKTYKPLPAQDGYYDLFRMPSNCAFVKVFMSEPSVCQNPSLDPNGGYRVCLQGGGMTIWYPPDSQYPFGHRDDSSVNACYEKHEMPSAGADYANFWYPQYKQTDYPTTHYGDSFSTRVIKQVGCFLCSMCAAMRSLGMYVTPLDMQAWLYSQPDGFANHTLVNPFAALRFINRYLNNGQKMAFIRNVPVDEANDRGLAVQNSVHNTHHWVNTVARKKRNENSPTTHHMLDSMYDVRHLTTLEDYSGYSLTNTRCWYWKNTWYRAMMLSEADWGISGIAAASLSNVNLTLLNSQSVAVQVATHEYLEDATIVSAATSPGSEPTTLSGQSEPSDGLVDCGMMLVAEKTPSDNYTVRVAGTPSAPYSVSVYNYDETGESYMKDMYGNPVYVKVYSGTIGASGYTDIAVPHLIGTVLGEAISPEGLADGTRLTFDTIGTVTAVIPGVGCYIQSPTLKGKRPLFVKTLNPTLRFGQTVNTVIGVVGTIEAQKCVLIDSGGYIDNYSVTSPAIPDPIGVSPEKVGTTWHQLTRTFGRITAKTTNDFTLLSSIGDLRVVCPTTFAVGSFVTVTGVEHQGAFYAVTSNIKLVQ